MNQTEVEWYLSADAQVHTAWTAFKSFTAITRIASVQQVVGDLWNSWSRFDPEARLSYRGWSAARVISQQYILSCAISKEPVASMVPGLLRLLRRADWQKSLWLCDLDLNVAVQPVKHDCILVFCSKKEENIPGFGHSLCNWSDASSRPPIVHLPRNWSCITSRSCWAVQWGRSRTHRLGQSYAIAEVNGQHSGG
jgi:hypothetical protein